MKKKQKEDVSTMFLVPKRIYFAVREAVGDDDKVNQLDRLNNDTNYIEKAIQFRQQKSYKSQPEALKETVSTLVNTSMMNNNKQPTQIAGETFPARNSEELSQDGLTSVSPLTASPLGRPNFIFPPVNRSEPENVKRQEEITLSHQEIAPENLLDSASQPQRREPTNVFWTKKDDVPPKLRCSFCNCNLLKDMEHLRRKHNYRPSLE